MMMMMIIINIISLAFLSFSLDSATNDRMWINWSPWEISYRKQHTCLMKRTTMTSTIDLPFCLDLFPWPLQLNYLPNLLSHHPTCLPELYWNCSPGQVLQKGVFVMEFLEDRSPAADSWRTIFKGDSRGGRGGLGEWQVCAHPSLICFIRFTIICCKYGTT